MVRADGTARHEVLRGLRFDRFLVAQAEIGLNFVESTFEQCVFRDILSKEHFWGARDNWNHCSFERCRLDGMIAPVNTFSGCHFRDSELKNLRPHQTLFANCDFFDVKIAALKPVRVSNRRMSNQDMEGADPQVLFRECRFHNVSFTRCYFGAVRFEKCTFQDVEAVGCDFTDVVSDAIWWKNEKGDPFLHFLGEAHRLIAAKCGAGSAAYREFGAYISQFDAGQTTSKDFSAYLYNNRVPYAEAEKVIDDLCALAESCLP